MFKPVLTLSQFSLDAASLKHKEGFFASATASSWLAVSRGLALTEAVLRGTRRKVSSQLCHSSAG